MNLLSDNDWNTLSNALRRGEALSLTRTLGNLELTAETAEAPEPWSSEMLIGVEVRKNGRVLMRQWFDSAESAKNTVRRWRVW